MPTASDKKKRYRAAHPEQYRIKRREQKRRRRARLRAAGIPAGNKKNESFKERRRQHKKECRAEVRGWYQSFKKTLTCQVCPETESVCLEFHHIDPISKDFDVSEAEKMTLTRLKLEVAKCACVCSNCHKKIHAGIVTTQLVPIIL